MKAGLEACQCLLVVRVENDGRQRAILAPLITLPVPWNALRLDLQHMIEAILWLTRTRRNGLFAGCVGAMVDSGATFIRWGRGLTIRRTYRPLREAEG